MEDYMLWIYAKEEDKECNDLLAHISDFYDFIRKQKVIKKKHKLERLF